MLPLSRRVLPTPQRRASPWTTERIRQLRRRWRQGTRVREIAAELGDGITCNAVISKIHRLGISALSPYGGAPGRRFAAKTPAADRPVYADCAAWWFRKGPLPAWVVNARPYVETVGADARIPLRGRRARSHWPDHHAGQPVGTRFRAQCSHARAVFGRTEISPSLVSCRPCRPLRVERSQSHRCNRSRRVCGDGEDGKPTLPSATIPRGGASRRQDRIPRIGMGGLPGNCARAGRPDIGLEQSTASLCGRRRTDENGFGRAVQAVGDWALKPRSSSLAVGTAWVGACVVEVDSGIGRMRLPRR